MKKPKTTIVSMLFFATAFIGWSCHRIISGNQTPAGLTTTEAMEHSMSHRVNMFAFDLLKSFTVVSENLVVSPFSISSTMALAYAGAAGTTKKEMERALHFKPRQKKFHRDFSRLHQTVRNKALEKVQLHIANNLWLQQGYSFRRQFINLLEKYYKIEAREVDYSGGNREHIREKINQWVFEETRENVSDLIAPGVLTEDTRLVLVNAIHFMGNWLYEFDPHLTRQEYFTNFDKQRVKADFMIHQGRFAYYDGATFQALKIPYAGGNFSMIVVLPDDKVALSAFQEGFSAEVFQKTLENMNYRDIRVMIPRFRSETRSDLKPIFAAMGMHEAFSQNADFRGMTGNRELKIDKIVHQATIEVGEQGTEAAAATAVVIVQKSVPVPEEPPLVFKADRPFLYFIIENSTSSILFAGRQVKF